MCSIIQNTRCLLACAWAGLAVRARTDTTACLVRTFLVWRDFFVAKCNLWIHYTTHTFWVTAGCLIIVQALVATLGYKKKLGPDPFHNKYMCSCCCCCTTTRLAAEMLFFQGAARNILNLSAHSTRNHLFFLTDWTDSAAAQCRWTTQRTHLC